jgi:hypothetical protein
LLTLVLGLACDGVGRNAEDDAAPHEETAAPPDSAGPDAGLDNVTTPDATEEDFAPQPGCQYESDGSLPSLTIDLSGNKCKFTLAEAAGGIKFSYRIKVAKKLEKVASIPLDAGKCDEVAACGLRMFEKIYGGDNHFCWCDAGLCGKVAEPLDIAGGTYSDSFVWNGRNWNGPSDTGTPPGEPFPPGTYTLVLRAEGTFGVAQGEFAETATMKIELTE